MKIKLYACFSLFALLLIHACSKPNDYSNRINVEVIKDWKLLLQSSSENHPTPGVIDTATLYFNIYSDNSIRFDVFIDSLTKKDDGLTGIQLGFGDPVTDGTLIMNLPARVSPENVTGILTGVRQSLIDTLLNNNIDKYINLLSRQAPTGLLRGQINHPIRFSASVSLTGTAMVPSVSTGSTGMAYVRVTHDSLLYTKVVVNDADADPATSAAIYDGVAGANGNLLRTIASSAADFNVSKKWTLNGSEFNQMLNNRSYIRVNTALFPNGKLRGQLRR